MRLFRRSSRSGFTLIELMVVVIIVAILAAAAVPIYLSNTRKAKMSEAMTGMGAARTQERIYMAEHEVYLAVASGVIGNDPSDTPAGLGLDFTLNTYFDEDCYVITLDATYGFVVTVLGSASTAPRAADVADYSTEMRGDGTTRVDYGDGWLSWE